MSWKDWLEPASFRGARFFISSSETTVGRRTKLHTYFRRDVPYLQDLGAAPDEFILEGYVIQNASNDFNHFQDKEQLIKALKRRGPGQLVHPYFGELRVGLKEVAVVTETTEEGGIARFTMHFAQVGRSRLTSVRDFRTIFDLLSDLLRAKGLDEFVDAFNSISEAINDITSTLNNIANTINTIKNGISSAIAKATGIISGIIATLNTILDAPCDLANALMDGADAIKNVVGMGADILSFDEIGSCSGLSDSEKNPNSILEGTTETLLDGNTIPEELGISVLQVLATSVEYSAEDIETENGIPVSTEHSADRVNSLNLIKLGLLTVAAEIGIRVEFSSREKQEENTELIATSIENTLADLGTVSGSLDVTEVDDDIQNVSLQSSFNDVLYDAMYELKKTWVKYMYEKGADLVKIVEYTVPAGVQSVLTLSYDKYIDVKRDDEIFKKNRPIIKHPGFLPGGEIVELLSE
jgi:prophage DNA circulation protein